MLASSNPPSHLAVNLYVCGWQRSASGMRHSLSMTDMDFKRGGGSPAPMDGSLVSPTSAMTWATYVKTIEEGNEVDGIFF